MTTRKNNVFVLSGTYLEYDQYCQRQGLDPRPRRVANHAQLMDLPTPVEILLVGTYAKHPAWNRILDQASARGWKLVYTGSTKIGGKYHDAV